MTAIYLDHNASTPVAASVRDAMRPWLDDGYGNPSSGHWAGAPARAALDAARADVAALLNARPAEIVFTSGGSEANNLALKGVVLAAWRGAGTPPHVVTTSVEHPAIHAPCRFLASLGVRVTTVPVDGTGRVDPERVRAAIEPETVLVSVMHANNEVGTIQPIREIAAHTRARGVRLHTDAAQSLGKVDVDVETLGVDLLSVAGHKLYAPKGVGALYVRDGVQLEPLVHGADHEAGRRAGTESALLAVGLGAACRLARTEPCGETLAALSTWFWDALRERFGEQVVLNGHAVHRLPNTVHVSFLGRDGRVLLDRLDGVAASTGSACHEGETRLSPVLVAMGCDEATGRGAIRFSLGRGTTRDELDTVVRSLEAAIGRPRPL